MNENAAHISLLRQSVTPAVADSIVRLIETGRDHELNRVNVLAFATANWLREEEALDGFLHASKLGLFELSWNVLCPGCGGVLDANTTLRTLDRSEYHCALCLAGYEPTLDEMVEVTFTVSPRVRRISAHDPDSLPIHEYARQIFWGSGTALPDEGIDELIRGMTLEVLELAPGERGVISVQIPESFIIVFDPVTHTTQFLDVKGPPTTERRHLSMLFDETHTHTGTMELAPGPLRLQLENRAQRRVLPGLWIAGEKLHALLGHRRPFLTAKRLLTSQTFRELFRTDTLDVDQRLKITSLTFLFTDLKGSTALYDRVGDLAAFDLVRAHFRLLLEIVASEAGAVVKTIGDAVMATFPTPDRAVAAALRMRDAMKDLNDERGREELLLNIGVHEGPCLAVMLNDRQDYFGQTVNVAARVQGLADPSAILATEPVMADKGVRKLLAGRGGEPGRRTRELRGVTGEMTLYEIA
jgi:class 3 adenylate cyclase